MDIATRRFRIWTSPDIPGMALIRDSNAPYHCHSIPISEAPSAHQMAMMKERDFDKAMSRLAYGGV